MFTLFVDLVFGIEYVQFQIISSLLYSIIVDTLTVDPHSIQYEKCLMKPNNCSNYGENETIRMSWTYHMETSSCLERLCEREILSLSFCARIHLK